MMTLALRRLSRPSTYIALSALLFVVNLLVFSRVVYAQTTAGTGGDLSYVTQVLTAISSIGFLVVVVVGFVWYVWKGKDAEHLAKQNARLRDDVGDFERKATELERKYAGCEKRILELEQDLRSVSRDAERLRKANLKLQGIHDDE